MPLPGNVDDIGASRANSLQKAVLQLLISTNALFGISSFDEILTNSLLFGLSVVEGLPNDQWIHETTSWLSSSFASLQIAMSSTLR